MRLGVYTDYAYHERDGEVLSERAFSLFLAPLAEHLESVTVIGRLAPAATSGARYPLGPGVRFAPLPYYERLTHLGAALRGMAGSLRRFWGLCGELDCVWLFMPHPLAIAFAAIAVLRRKRVVFGVRQDFRRYIGSRHPRRPLLRGAAAALEWAYLVLARLAPVVVVGPELARRYRRSRRLLEVSVSLVREDEVAPAAEVEQRDYSGELTALSVGRLEREKNPLLLAEALALLRGRGEPWRLLVCGEGEMEGALRGRLEELGVAEHAELAGYVPLDRGLHDLYRSSHALLHVSWTEGVPQVLYEAFAAALPVVATDVGGVREAAGEAARLIPPGDPEAAARELARVGRDAALRRRLAEAGHTIVSRRTLEAESHRVAEFLTAAVE